MSIAAYCQTVSHRLEKISATARLDAQVLVAHVMGVNRAWVLAHQDAGLTPEQAQRLEAALVRLEAGDPLPYVLGHWEFFGLEFEVSPAVLIPRPETELLVERVLEWQRAHPKPRLGADVGTGSGCVAVALATNDPYLRVVACDISGDALAVARNNLQKHNVCDDIDLVNCDLLSAFPRKPASSPPFDFICANLPYIPTEILKELRVSKSEPWKALHGGLDGLETIRGLLQTAPEQLAPGGLLLMEIEASLGAKAKKLALAAFPGANVYVLRDIAGHERLVVVETA